MFLHLSKTNQGLATHRREKDTQEGDREREIEREREGEREGKERQDEPEDLGPREGCVIWLMNQVLHLQGGYVGKRSDNLFEGILSKWPLQNGCFLAVCVRVERALASDICVSKCKSKYFGLGCFLSHFSVLGSAMGLLALRTQLLPKAAGHCPLIFLGASDLSPQISHTCSLSLCLYF